MGWAIGFMAELHTSVSHILLVMSDVLHRGAMEVRHPGSKVKEPGSTEPEATSVITIWSVMYDAVSTDTYILQMDVSTLTLNVSHCRGSNLSQDKDEVSGFRV